MFLLQIVHPDGTILRGPAGEKLELDLRVALKDAILARGVGFLKTEAHVAEDIDAGIAEAFETFKAQALPWRVS
jgi:hypothetical protein